MRRLHSRFEKKVSTGDATNSRVEYPPRAKRPVIPIYGIGEFTGFSTRKRIAHVAIGVERKTTDGKCQFERDQRERVHTSLNTSLRCGECRNS